MIDELSAERLELSMIIEDLARGARRKLPVLRSGPTDCQGCGRCCEFFEAIDVFAEDEEQNFEWLKNNGYLTEDNEHAMYAMRKVGDTNRCVALVGEVGKDTRCSIYQHRPEACRRFESGGGRCRSILILENYDCFVRCH